MVFTNRHMITTKWLLKFTAGYYTVIVLVGILLTTSDNTIYIGSDPCPNANVFSYMNSLWLIIDLIIVCFFAKKIHSVEIDSFNIQKEMKRVGIFTITALIFWQVETAFLTVDAQNYYVTSDFDNCLIIFVDLIWVTFFPLYASFHQNHQVQSSAVSYNPVRKSVSPRGSARSYDSSTLEAVLDHPLGYQDFFGFLAKEWSTENLLFWKQVNEYKVIADPEQRTKKAQAIYETFIRENAIYEVNLPDTIRSKLRLSVEQILAQGENIPSNIFDGAQNEIFSLMSNDSFHRFIKTEESFVELSELQTSDVRNSSPNGSRKDGSSATGSYGAPMETKETSSTPSRVNTSTQTAQDEMEELDAQVIEETPDETQHVFVL